METILTKWFGDIIRQGDLSIHQDLAIVPLYCNQEGGPEYITLKNSPFLRIDGLRSQRGRQCAGIESDQSDRQACPDSGW